MQQSLSENNPSDSMISQSLPNYNFFNSSNPQGDESSSFQFTNIQSQLHPFKGTIYQPINDKMNEIKINIFKQRNQMMEKGILPKSNRQVINPLMRNDQLNEQIKQKQLQVQKKTQDIDNLNEEVENLKAQQKKIDRKIESKEYIKKFENKLKQKFKQERVYYQDQKKTHSQAVNLLKQNLEKRSKATLDRLLPYLKYSEQQCKERNQEIERANKEQEIEGKKYEEQAMNYQQMIQQRTENSKRNLISDLIEDQKRINQEFRKYDERQSQDLYLNKQRQSMNQYEE